jgi:hypothetical protein
MLCLVALCSIRDRFYVYNIAGTADGEEKVVPGYVLGLHSVAMTEQKRSLVFC